jgi:hypothetical protein
MGFWRGVGYVFASILLIAGIISFPIGIVLIVPAVIWMWLLKKSGQVSRMQKDLKQIRIVEDERMRDDLIKRQRQQQVFQAGLSIPSREFQN